jgi:hypothetical protein
MSCGFASCGMYRCGGWERVERADGMLGARSYSKTLTTSSWRAATPTSRARGMNVELNASSMHEIIMQGYTLRCLLFGPFEEHLTRYGNAAAEAHIITSDASCILQAHGGRLWRNLRSRTSYESTTRVDASMRVQAESPDGSELQVSLTLLPSLQHLTFESSH